MFIFLIKQDQNFSYLIIYFLVNQEEELRYEFKMCICVRRVVP
jgi:hypothetical protein